MIIKKDDLADGAVIKLLSEHHQKMHLYSPVESIHALDESSLKDSSIQFWSAWVEDELAGCGALMEITKDHAEIKSMRTADRFLRCGVAANILQTILDHARFRNYHRVSLETGTHPAFSPAVALYKKLKFLECAPFASYTQDPYSQFLTLVLPD